MKKLIISAFTMLFISSSMIAQDGENNLKNFRFGLKVAPQLDWFRADEKTIEMNGLKTKFSYGLIMEFRLNNVISLATGIEGAYNGGKLTYNDSAVYYYSKTDEFMAPGDTVGNKGKYSMFLLNARDFNVNYVVLPIGLKMKTKAIGGITYFGNFGVDIGVRTKAKATDDVTYLNGVVGTKTTQKDLDITKDMNLIRMNLNASAGIEYNLAGSTSLLASISYRRGFISAPKAESENIYLMRDKETKNAFKQKALLDGITLNVGILF